MERPIFCADDGRFGPVSTCRAFDFTLRFESSILFLLPNAIFELVSLGLIVWTLLSSRRYIQLPVDRGSTCMHRRDGGAILLAVVHLALVVALLAMAPRVLPGVPSSSLDTLVMPSLVFEAFSALIILCVLTFHRPARSTAIVTLINTFLLFTSLFSAVQLRTFYFVPAARSSAFLPLLAADLGAKSLLFASTSTKPFDPRQTAEERASFVSKIFFLYLLVPLWKGTRKPIELDDIEPLAPSYSSRTLEARLFRYWHASAGGSAVGDHPSAETGYPDDVKSRDLEPVFMSDLGFSATSAGRSTFLPKDPSSRPHLIRATIRAFAGVLLSPVPAKAVYTVMILLQPLLVQETLDFIASYSDPLQTPKPAAHGWGIVGAFLLVYLLLALSSGHFTFSIYKATCKLRGALVYTVYRKTLVLSADALQDGNTPSPTVMQSVDIERIVGGLDPALEVGSAIIVIGVSLYLLWQQIGVSFLATIVTLAFLFASIPLMAKDTSAKQREWSKLTDERTGLTSAAINSIKAVKQSALESFLISKISSIRHREVDALIRYLYDILFGSLLGNSAGDVLLASTVVTFALVSAFHHHSTGAFPFTTSTVFTSITIVRIIERPLFTLARKYASVLSTVTSLKRLETFLLLPEQVAGERGAGCMPATENVHLAATAAVTFDRVSFAWKQGANNSSSTDVACTSSTSTRGSLTNQAEGPVLRDISLVVPRAQLTVVVGEVSTGKTSLLCSLLGELQVLQGEAMLSLRSAPVAYVSQNPWTQGERSIKENVVFYRLFDEARYQLAIKACGLALDVQQLPKGDGTLAKHLSGGQKQRLALCRAVYADAPTYILDDVLSAVDAPTAASINRALFSRKCGLLRGKTVIMATNSLQQMQLADQIIQMTNNGGAEMLEGGETIVSKLAGSIETIRRRSSEERDSIDADGESSAAAEVRAAAARERKVLDVEEEQEEIMKGGLKLSVFVRYFNAAGWWVAVIYTLALVAQTGLANGQLLWLQAWAKQVTEDTMRDSLALHIGVVILLVVSRVIIYGGSLLIYMYLLCPPVSRKLHHDEITGMLRSGADFFLNINAGRMINRFTQDIYGLDYQIPAFVVNLVYFIVELGYSLVFMALPAPYLLGAMVAMATLYFGIYKLYSPSSRILRRLELSTKSPLHSQFKDTADLQGLLTIRALQMEATFADATASLLDTSQRPYYSLWTVRVWLLTWLNLLGMVLNTTLVLIAVSLRHKSNAGLVAVALIQAISISSDLNGLMSSWTELEIGIVSLERIEQVITTPADPKDDKTKLTEMPSTGLAEDRYLTAVGVSFEDVTVGYGGTEGSMSLRGVSFTLRPGERLGVCGRSGSGKSTLLLSLLRILEPASGRILIDGVDTATLTGDSVRRNISYIPQEPMVLPSLSVRENLDPENEHTDDQIYYKVLKQTSMLETISQLPQGLDHPLDLQSLSMGQKQLLNVARALLKRRGLLVMDEATSNLDSDTDAQIQAALASAAAPEKNGCESYQLTRAQSKRPIKPMNADGDGFVAVPGRPTTITIAHRLSTIMDYDKILVLSNGEVLEFGSPSELLAKTNGEFSSMVEEQNRKVD
ncbi:putative Metal resistance protein YCF1 (putative) [Pseudozyma hubeiensis]|nr:putative Metal resistance protein YCF1 (putative) [Pseudozyma hubeiensis]